MQFVENPLRRRFKQTKVTDEEDGSTSSTKLELADAIKAMAKILYERECVNNEGLIYAFDEMRSLLEERKPTLKEFSLVARPFECNKQTMDRMKRIMVICLLR